MSCPYTTPCFPICTLVCRGSWNHTAIIYRTMRVPSCHTAFLFNHLSHPLSPSLHPGFQLQPLVLCLLPVATSVQLLGLLSGSAWFLSTPACRFCSSCYGAWSVLGLGCLWVPVVMGSPTSAADNVPHRNIIIISSAIGLARRLLYVILFG